MSRHISEILQNVLRDVTQATEDRGSNVATAMHDTNLAVRAPLSQFNSEESECYDV